MERDQERSYRIGLKKTFNDEVLCKVPNITILRLLMEYNKRFIGEEEALDFEEKVNDKYKELLTHKDVFLNGKMDEKFLEIINLCDDEIKKQYKLGKDAKQGLYNVHVLLGEKEIDDKKESRLEANKLAKVSDKIASIKNLYFEKRSVVYLYNSLLNDEEKMEEFCKRSSGIPPEYIKERILVQSKVFNEEFITKENALMSLLVHEMVKDYARINNPANNTMTMA